MRAIVSEDRFTPDEISRANPDATGPENPHRVSANYPPRELQVGPEEALAAIGQFRDIDINRSPIVEPASVSPFCACGDLLMASALAGCGKTTLATDILIGAAHPSRQGIAAGGLLRINHGGGEYTKCAVIDAESTLVRWSSVVRRKIELYRLEPRHLSTIRYIRAYDFGLQSPSRREHNSRVLAAALAHDRRRLVIIDTLAAVWAPSNLNDPDWVFTGLKPFREACQEFGITIICFAHTSRRAGSESQSFSPIGSSHQENQADALLAISRTKHHGHTGINIVHRKSRRSFWIARDSSVYVRFTPEYGYEPLGNGAQTWQHDWSPADEDGDHPDTPLRLRIQQAIRNAADASLSTKEISIATGVPERTIRQHLKALVTDGIVSKERGGPATRYRYVR